MFLCRQLHIIKLVAIHGRRTQRPDFSCLHQIIQRFHSLLNRCFIVKAMDDVEIQVICSQTL